MTPPLCPKCQQRERAPGRYYCLDCLFDTLNELARLGKAPEKMPARVRMAMERRMVAERERFSEESDE